MAMLNLLGFTRFLILGSVAKWPIVVAVGALPYPVTFLCADLIGELWGERRASQLVWVGFLHQWLDRADSLAWWDSARDRRVWR